MISWFRWPTRLFGVLVAAGALVMAAWASTTASEAERYIPSLAIGTVIAFCWRFGFSPSVHRTPTHVIVEQPWGTWHIPVGAIVEVTAEEGALNIKTATKHVVAFGLSSSLLLSMFGDKQLKSAVRALEPLTSQEPLGSSDVRVRVTGWRLLIEVVAVLVVFLSVGIAARAIY